MLKRRIEKIMGMGSNSLQLRIKRFLEGRKVMGTFLAFLPPEELVGSFPPLKTGISLFVSCGKSDSKCHEPT